MATRAIAARDPRDAPAIGIPVAVHVKHVRRAPPVIPAGHLVDTSEESDVSEESDDDDSLPDLLDLADMEEVD